MGQRVVPVSARLQTTINRSNRRKWSGREIARYSRFLTRTVERIHGTTFKAEESHERVKSERTTNDARRRNVRVNDLRYFPWLDDRGKLSVIFRGLCGSIMTSKGSRTSTCSLKWVDSFRFAFVKKRCS